MQPAAGAGRRPCSCLTPAAHRRSMLLPAPPLRSQPSTPSRCGNSRRAFPASPLPSLDRQQRPSAVLQAAKHSVPLQRQAAPQQPLMQRQSDLQHPWRHLRLWQRDWRRVAAAARLGSDDDDDDDDLLREDDDSSVDSVDDEEDGSADDVEDLAELVGSADEEAVVDDDDEDVPEDLNLDDLIGDDDTLPGTIASFADEPGTEPDSETGLADEDLPSAADIPEPEPEPESQYDVPPERVKTLGQLLTAANFADSARVQLTAEQLATEITNVEYDPRKVGPGCLFVCMVAETFDGHDFTECAMEFGAAAFITQRQLEHDDLPADFPVLQLPETLSALGPLAAAFFDNPSEKMAVVGVTGSAGKTTTTWLVRSIFEELGQLTGMLGSLEYAIAEDRMTEDGNLWKPPEEDPTLKRDCSTPYHLAPYVGKYGVPRSTPDSLAMHKILAGVADRGGASAVIECTTTGLQEGRTDEVDFDIVVFTNLTAENLDSGDGVRQPESMEQHLDIMAGLFRRLNDPDRQRAIVNVDDPYADAIKQAGISVPLVTYAINDRDADVLAEKVKFGLWETDILIRTPLGRLQIITPLVGKANVYNVLAAVAVGVSLNVNLRAIVAGIEAVDVVPGRTELIDEGQTFPVIVDSANTPEALTRLLEGLRETGARRVLTVFGAEGGVSPESRPVLGEILHYKSDFVFVTSNNPRLEQPEDIVQQLVAGFPEYMHQYGAIPGMQHWLAGDADSGMDGTDWVTKQERLKAQGLFRRIVFTDRFTAIRAAIGTAQEKDVVVIAGKGAQDYQEYGMAFPVDDDDRVDADQDEAEDKEDFTEDEEDLAVDEENFAEGEEDLPLMDEEDFAEDEKDLPDDAEEALEQPIVSGEADTEADADAAAGAADVPLQVEEGDEEEEEEGDEEAELEMYVRLVRGWFDDRVEARNALSKLPFLESLKDLDRKEIPWTGDASERDERVDVLMGCDVRQFKS